MRRCWQVPMPRKSRLICFDQATKLAQLLGAVERGYSSKQIALALVETGRTQAAEDLVLSIDHAASRGDALGVLGSKYAERGDVKTSRARFSAAFEVALKIDVPMGLDTAYSKGGAIRILARNQAIVDMPGLQEYLSAAKNPKHSGIWLLGSRGGPGANGGGASQRPRPGVSAGTVGSDLESASDGDNCWIGLSECISHFCRFQRARMLTRATAEVYRPTAVRAASV